MSGTIVVSLVVDGGGGAAAHCMMHGRQSMPLDQMSRGWYCPSPRQYKEK